jgi:imidazolonepropionase-like amidohydrolase
MGTDTGAPTGRFQGYFEHVELEYMVNAGLNPMQTLVASTSNVAKFLHASDLGTLEPGKSADLVVLNANPLDDIKNTRKIDSVYIAGNRVSDK